MIDRPTVSVVLLSYNRPRLLREALASVLVQTFESLEVIVVDNESESSEEVARVVVEAARAAADRRPEEPARRVSLIRTRVNLGFSGGMNLGIARARGRYVYLTEDDIRLSEDCLERFVEYAVGQKEIGLLAPLISNSGDGTIRCAGGSLTLGGVFGNVIYGAGQRDAGQFSEPFDVTFAPGQALFCESDFIRRVGGFREEFFMYSEDRELCMRVAAAGRAVTVVPRAKVYHFDPAETGVGPELQYHGLKNFYALYLLHAPARVLPEFFCRYVLLKLFGSMRGLEEKPATLFKAWWWVVINARVLLADRKRPGRRDGKVVDTDADEKNAPKGHAAVREGSLS